jgi:hypothetical protein
MQTRIVTRPAIAAMALVIAWTASPRAGLAQQCRRTCETGETRDVRGCCVPAAKPARPEAKPERPPRRERPAREAPAAEAPAAKPSEPPAAKPSESSARKPSPPPARKPSPPPASKSSEASAVKPNRRPSEPGSNEPLVSKPREPTRTAASEEEKGTRTMPVPGAASGTTTIQKAPRAGDAPTIQAHGATQTETSAASRDEPGPPQVQDFDKSFDELLAEAQEAARNGLYDQARRQCSQALDKRPGDARAIMLCAIAACNARDTRWATHYYAMASAGQKHGIYNICSAKGIDVRTSEPPASKPGEVPMSKTDGPPGSRNKEPPAPETPGAAQRRQTGQTPDATAPGHFRIDPRATTRTEPMAPSRPAVGRPTDARPGMLEPPRVALAPSPPVAEQELRHRWPGWMPWAVIGAGLAMTGVGIAYSEYHSEVPELADQLDRARPLETTSRISLIAGSVTVAAGVALVFLNQVTEPTSERAAARTFVVPTLGPSAAGISAGVSF